MRRVPTAAEHSRSATLLTIGLMALFVSLGAQAQEPSRPPGPQWGETLLLALNINGVPQDGMLRAVRLAEGLAIPRSVWDELHLRLPTGTPKEIDGEMHVMLSTLGPLRWHIDEASQTLEIEAPANAFTEQRLDMGAAVPHVTQPSAWAPFLNYDAQWQSRTGSASSGDVLWEAGLFTPKGDFSSTGLARSSGSDTRLETRWRHDDPSHMTRVTIGDSINQAGAWGRALRFAGVQWGTDFSLQPGFLTFPLPSLRGEAALPSTLDVYVNNGQRLQGRLQAGAFDLSELPVVTGQGEIRTVVRDLLGREQTVITPYYASPELLKPGLRAFSVELGSIRNDYGIYSNHYGSTLLTATERRGITDNFTSELRAEITARQQAAGLTGWTLWPSLGTASASAVVSRDRDQGSGWMVMAGFDRQARNWSGSLQVQHSSPGFTQLGLSPSTAPRNIVTLALGTSWSGQSIGMSLVRQTGGAVESKIAQINYGADFGNWGYVGVVALRDFASGSRGTTIGLTWSRSLDLHHSLGMSVQRQPIGNGVTQTQVQMQLQRNPGFGSDYGYQLMAENGGHQLAQGTWQTQYGVLSGGVARRGSGDVETRAGASGGLVWLNGGAFAGRRIDGGIAVVDVGGYEGVGIMQDNQIVSHTDAKGHAFVTGLRGYQPNRIGIDASDLPMDVEIDALQIRVTPAARSAMTIDFPIQRGHAVMLKLLDKAGKPLQPGTMLKVPGTTRVFPVGLEGRVYLAGLSVGYNKVTAVWPEGQCQFDFTLTPPGARDDLPDLGALTCR
jgi:outer membrane usher protein